MKKLKKNFFERDTLEVAEELLGKIVVREVDGKVIKGRIIETEAYIGTEDKACHARHGKTKRNEVMWGPAGFSYVYLCMGLHNLLNIVTEKDGFPAAVLIRRIEPLELESPWLLHSNDNTVRTEARTMGPGCFSDARDDTLKLKSFGPGNLTKLLKIDKSLNGTDITISRELYIVDDGYVVRPESIERKARVGIDYAEEYKDKLWRFVLLK